MKKSAEMPNRIALCRMYYRMAESSGRETSGGKMTDFYNFFMNGEPLHVEIPEIIKIYMRNFYCKLSIDIATADVLNSYWMQVVPRIVLYRYGEKCKKCGYSTLYTALIHKECWGNHHWTKDYCSLWGTDLQNATSEKLAEEFEHFLIHSTERVAGHKEFVNNYVVVKNKEFAK